MKITKDISESIKELRKILEIEGDSFRSGKLLRNMELNNWLCKWVQVVEETQLVVDVKYLEASQHDDLRRAMTLKLIDKVLEECVTIKQEDRRVTISLTGIRRKASE